MAASAPALAFVRGETQWIARQLQHLPKPVALVPGAVVPFLGAGASHPSRANAWSGAGLDGVAARILVSGRMEHAPRRLADFFKREARALLSTRAMEYAARLGLRPCRVTVRDTRSRWGSCSQNGSLSFSWRLIFAPGICARLCGGA